MNVNEYKQIQAKKRERAARRLRRTGFALVFIAVLMAGLSLYLNGQLSLLPKKGYTPETVASKPTPEAIWSAWLDADASSLDNAYFIRSLDDERKTLCSGLYQGILAFEEQITLPEPIHKDTLSDIMWLIKYDCPELFHITGEYTYFVRPDTPDMVFSIRPNYCMDAETYLAACDEIDRLLEGWKAQAEGLTTYETEKLLYDNIMQGCTYQETGEHTGTVYGALILGRARCEGYAQAVNMVMRRAGIDSMIVTGEATALAEDGSIEDVERHAWNVVKIGEGFYHIDATWDDADDTGDKKTTYAYFNLTDAEMWRSRTLDAIYSRLSLPTCEQITYNYFVYNGTYIDAEADTKEAFYAILSRAVADEQKSGVSVKFETAEQYSALISNLKAWMENWYTEMGFRSGSYSWTTFPDARVIYFNDLLYE